MALQAQMVSVFRLWPEAQILPLPLPPPPPLPLLRIPLLKVRNKSRLQSRMRTFFWFELSPRFFVYGFADLSRR